MSPGIIALWVLSFPVGMGVAEVFSSYAHVEQMIDPAGPIAETLERFVRAEEQRLEETKKALDGMKSHMVAAWADREAQLNNPINVYFLMKTFAADWSALKPLLSAGKGADVVADIDAKTPLSEKEDIDGAALSLFRLQDTYNLNATQISSGMLSEAYRSPQFTALDCFELGSIALAKEDMYHALMWMQETLSRLDQEAVKSVDRFRVLDLLANCTFKQGNLRHAMSLLDEMLVLNPQQKGLDERRDTLQRQLAEAESKGQVAGDSRSVRNERTGRRNKYEALCRGEQVMSDPARTSKFRCYYLTRNNPRLLLSPAKVEEVFDRPSLLLFHDILLESEMELIKTLARPNLSRAAVVKRDTLEVEKTRVRTSKSAWLTRNVHPRIPVFNQRFEDYTGLDFTTAEDIQVANYGLGGHYEPHFDSFPESAMNTTKRLEPGNRIATLLLYMSDVSAGGATVFPNIGARIVPRKGTAVFWYNLHRNGTGNSDTLHAACPVLLGNKWAVNKWFREHGQELRRPCSLDRSQ